MFFYVSFTQNGLYFPINNKEILILREKCSPVGLLINKYQHFSLFRDFLIYQEEDWNQLKNNINAINYIIKSIVL